MLEEKKLRITIENRQINCLAFANNIAIIVEAEKLQEMINIITIID